MPVCKKCLDELNAYIVFSAAPEQTGHFFKKAYHCLRYEGIVKDLIHKFKYGRKTLLRNLFTQYLYDMFVRHIACENIDIIVPVPMRLFDERKKGFNHSALLAKGLSEKTKIEFCQAVVKLGNPKAQAGLKRAQRLENVKNTFCVNKNLNLKTKTVLIVDDVLTTGATINECARSLMQAQAKKILALTLARGV